MNISKQNIDELNATLTMKFGKEDYEERVNKVLKDYRKKANIPGFRPGNVPMGLINKMYRKPVLAEEINKMVSEKINEYIKTENLHVLGDPLPNETQNKTLDFDNDTDFEFVFDLGLAPKLDFEWTKKDKVTAYEIKLEDAMINSYVESYTRRFGKFMDTDTVVDNEMVKGDLVQVDEMGNIVEGGIVSNDVTVYLEIAKDENEKKSFKGAKAGSVVKFDIKKAFPNDFEIANLLKIEKEKVAETSQHFQMTIKSVSKFEASAINSELFDKVYGEGVVTTEEEFHNKIKEELRSQLGKDEDYKFGLDAKAMMLKKMNLTLPTAFLKRWITFMNEGKFTPEQIEKEFPIFEEDMKWQLIKNKIAKDNNLEVKEEEVVEQAKEVTRMQFRQYGINNMPEEHVTSYAMSILKKEEDVRKMVEQLLEKKVFGIIKQNATVEVKEISNEDFGKMFQEK
jgi:trigger factor